MIREEAIVRLLTLIKPKLFVLVFALAFGMFAPSIYSKPGAPISLHSANAYEIPAFSNAKLEIEFALPLKPGSLQVLLQTHEDITIVSEQFTQEFLLHGDEPFLKLPLEIEVSEAGKYYLLFNLIFTNEQGLSEAVPLAIRLQVGETEQQTGQQKTSSSSSGIKTLPAVETIK